MIELWASKEEKRQRNVSGSWDPHSTNSPTGFRNSPSQEMGGSEVSNKKEKVFSRRYIKTQDGDSLCQHLSEFSVGCY